MPVTVRFPVTVKCPLSRVPLVERFSFPKLIPCPSASILLLVKVKLPNDEPVEPDIVPLVERLLLPKLNIEVSLVMFPFDMVTSPMLEPVAALKVDVIVAVPLIVRSLADKFPLVDKLLSTKLMFFVASLVNICVSFIVILPNLELSPRATIDDVAVKPPLAVTLCSVELPPTDKWFCIVAFPFIVVSPPNIVV